MPDSNNFICLSAQQNLEIGEGAKKWSPMTSVSVEQKLRPRLLTQPINLLGKRGSLIQRNYFV